MSKFDNFKLKIYANCGTSPKYTYYGVFDTANVYFTPRTLSDVTLTSSSNIIGDRAATLTVNFDPGFLLTTGYIYLTFPYWYLKDGVQPTSEKMITI